MKLAIKKVVYKAFGLHIHSDFNLPELPVITGGKSGYRCSDRDG